MTCTVAVVGLRPGAMIGADTRASWQSGAFVDGLQKVHSIAPNVALGFAGSVELGFCAMNAARLIWKEMGAGAVRHPRRLAAPLAEVLSATWHEYPRDQQAMGLALLVAGTVPSPASGQENLSTVLSDGYVLRSPHFELKRLKPRVPEIIGVAGSYPTFREGFLKAGEYADDAPVEVMEHWLNFLHSIAHANQSGDRDLPTIGPYLKIAFVDGDPGGIRYRDFGGADPVVVNQTFDDFATLARRHGLRAAEALAGTNHMDGSQASKASLSHAKDLSPVTDARLVQNPR